MVQQIASAITLAVAALNAASSMALPMGSQAGDMDVLERDFDDIMDLDARDAHGWGEDLSARANEPLAKPPVTSQADGASNPLNIHAPSAAHGAPAHASDTVPGHAAPHPSGGVAPNGSKTMLGGPSKTVTQERTVTLKPTPCGKGKGKGHHGHKGHHAHHSHAGQPGEGKHLPSAPLGSAKASQPTPSGHLEPTPTPFAKNGKNKRATKPKPSSSASPFPSGSGVYPKITPAPSSSSGPPAPAGGHTSMTTKTKKGKDGTKTVVKVTLVRPTGCVELKGGPGHRHKNAGERPKGGHGSGQQGNPKGNGKGNKHKGNKHKGTKHKGNKHGRPGSNRNGKAIDHGHGKREIVDENEFFGRSAFELDELD